MIRRRQDEKAVGDERLPGALNEFSRREEMLDDLCGYDRVEVMAILKEIGQIVVRGGDAKPTRGTPFRNCDPRLGSITPI